MNGKSKPAPPQSSGLESPSGLPRRDFLRQMALTPALLSRPFSILEKIAASAAAPPAPAPIDYTTGPALLTFNEITELYREQPPPAALQSKLDRLLSTPFVSARAWQSGQRPLKPASPRLGTFLRVVQWNIDRGLQYDAIRLALSDAEGFSALISARDFGLSAEEVANIREQAAILRQADVIVLNEVDWGINRTLFRDVGAELADALNMNYAFGVEFVEVDPLTMGLSHWKVVREVRDAYAVPGDSSEQAAARYGQIMAPSPSNYLGLHGTAILTRYLLDNVRLVPFRAQGYDWYTGRKEHSVPQRAESGFFNVVFDEQMIRQARCGGRTMLLADLVDPDLPAGRVTLVATHLEDMTSPIHRRAQMREVLDAVANVNNPVIVAGDMNTTCHDGGDPVSPVGMIAKQKTTSAGSVAHTAEKIVRDATPLGWAYGLTCQLVGIVPKLDDPTRHRVPLLLDNTEAEFFDALEQFHFADGSRFDFRGDARRSERGKSGTLANSNERAEKGFVPTYELNRSYGLLASYKIDWIFVRPARLTAPRDSAQPYRFSPHFGRTLHALNHAIPGRISDHNPIAVDLPLAEPPVAPA